MTTTAPIRLERFPNIADHSDAVGELRSGLLNTDAAASHEILDAARGSFWTDDGEETDALHAFDTMKEEAVEEILPDVARMLTEAINRRMPWTWEPER